MLDPLTWILIAATMIFGGENVGKVQESPYNARNVAAVGIGVGVLAAVTAGIVVYGVYAQRGRTHAAADAFGKPLKSAPTFPEKPAAEPAPEVTPPAEPAPVEPAPETTTTPDAEASPPVPADPSAPSSEQAPPSQDPPLSGSGVEPQPAQ